MILAKTILNEIIKTQRKLICIVYRCMSDKIIKKSKVVIMKKFRIVIDSGGAMGR